MHLEEVLRGMIREGCLDSMRAVLHVIVWEVMDSARCRAEPCKCLFRTWFLVTSHLHQLLSGLAYGTISEDLLDLVIGAKSISRVHPSIH